MAHVDQQSFTSCYVETHPKDDNEYTHAAERWHRLLAEWNLIDTPNGKWPRAFLDTVRLSLTLHT